MMMRRVGRVRGVVMVKVGSLRVVVVVEVVAVVVWKEVEGACL